MRVLVSFEFEFLHHHANGEKITETYVNRCNPADSACKSMSCWRAVTCFWMSVNMLWPCISSMPDVLIRCGIKNFMNSIICEESRLCPANLFKWKASRPPPSPVCWACPQQIVCVQHQDVVPQEHAVLHSWACLTLSARRCDLWGLARLPCCAVIAPYSVPEK